MMTRPEEIRRLKSILAQQGMSEADKEFVIGLIAAGWTLSALRAAGWTPNDFVAAGWTPNDFIAAGWTPEPPSELAPAGCRTTS